MRRAVHRAAPMQAGILSGERAQAFANEGLHS